MEEVKIYPTNTGGADGVFDTEGALTGVTKLEGDVTYRTGYTTAQAFKHALKELGHDVDYDITPEAFKDVLEAVKGTELKFEETTQGTVALVINSEGTSTVVITVDELIDTMSNPDTTFVKLEADMEVNATLTADHSMTFDGNGKTITSNKNLFQVSGTDTVLTINNANIVATGAGSAVRIGDKNLGDGRSLKAIIGKDTTITADTYGVLLFGEGSTVDVEGTINVDVEGYGISGNGSSNYKGKTIVNIKDGANITSANGFALYLPQDGEVNITGGNLTGKSVIGIKAGKLNITGGTLTATGEAIDTTASYNGQEPTGDVIVAEVNKKYAGGKTDKNISINVENAELISQNAYKIKEINVDSSDITIDVTGKYNVATKLADDITVYDEQEITVE